MTETQAKSGGAGTSTTPAGEKSVGEAKGTDSGAAEPTVVGRAVVPGETPKFTRHPGMNPPPDTPSEGGVAAGSLSTPAPSSGAGTAAAKSQEPSKASETASVTKPVSVGAGNGEQTVRTTSPLAAAGGYGSGVAALQVPGATAGTAPVSAPPTSGAPVIARASVTMPRPVSAVPGTVPGQPSSAVGAARVTEAVRAARATVAGAAARGPRRARLHLKRIDPWSVMKFAFAVAVVLCLVAIVATSVLYVALDAMGVFTSINKALGEMLGNATGDGGFKITAKGVISAAGILGVINIVLFTALATLGAFVYNVCADLVGGIEVTLSEKD